MRKRKLRNFKRDTSRNSPSGGLEDSLSLLNVRKLNREEALAIARKYDGEFPDEFFEEVLEYLELSHDQFTKIVDQHRNPEIWKKDGNEWRLRYPVE